MLNGAAEEHAVVVAFWPASGPVRIKAAHPAAVPEPSLSQLKVKQPLGSVDVNVCPFREVMDVPSARGGPTAAVPL